MFGTAEASAASGFFEISKDVLGTEFTLGYFVTLFIAFLIGTRFAKKKTA